MTDIRSQLLSLADETYRPFIVKLLPTVAQSRIIGIRTPALRQLAKQLRGSEQAEAFLRALPHETFEETMLHAFLIGEIRDFDRCLRETDALLPYIDNWAICDSFRPPVFAKHLTELYAHVPQWLKDTHPYAVRFGIEALMNHFLDGAFTPDVLALVAPIRSEEYYVNMMIAWFFATALAKQHDAALPYIKERALDAWTHNKTIQKAVESRRLTDTQKQTLRALKVRNA